MKARNSISTAIKFTSFLGLAGFFVASAGFADTFNILTPPPADNPEANTVTTANSNVTINFLADETATVQPDVPIAGSIRNLATRAKDETVNKTGTLIFEGSSVVSNTIGEAAQSLKAIEARGGAGTTVTVNGKTYSGSLAITNGGTFITDTVVGSVTGTNGTGILTLNGGASGGDIGTPADATTQLGEINFQVVDPTQTTDPVFTLGHNLGATNISVADRVTLTLFKDIAVSSVFAYDGDLTIGAGTSGGLNIGMFTLNGTGVGGGNGNVVFETGSTLSVGVGAAGSSGSISTTGNATMPDGVKLDITVSGFVPNDQTFVIINAAGGTVTPPANANITDNSYVLDFTASSLSAGDLRLIAARNSENNYVSVAQDENVRVMATLIESPAFTAGANSTDDDIYTVLGYLDSIATSDELLVELTEMLPTHNGATSLVNFAGATQLHNVLTTRLSAMQDFGSFLAGGLTGVSAGDGPKNQAWWLQGLASTGEQDDLSGVNGFESQTWGALAGYDRKVGSHHRLGLAVGSQDANIRHRSQNSTDSTEVTSYSGSLFGQYQFQTAYLDAMVGGTWHSYDSIRETVLNRNALGNYDGQQYSARVEWGYPIAVTWKTLSLTPLLSMDYSHLAIDGYTESGAGAANLTVSSESLDSLKSGLGARLSFLHPPANLGVELHSRWFHDFTTEAPQYTSTFQGGTGSFVTNGTEFDADAINIGTSIGFFAKNELNLSAHYDGEFKDGYNNSTGALKAWYAF